MELFPEITLYISLLLWENIFLKAEGLDVHVLELQKLKLKGHTEISSPYPVERWNFLPLSNTNVIEA